jgi:integrase
MATFTDRSGSIYAQVRMRGVTDNQTFPRMAEARAWAKQREQEIKDGAAGRLPRKSLADAVERYKREVCPTHKSGRIESYRLDFMLTQLPASRPLSSITVDLLTEWKDKRLSEVKPATLLREFNLLQSMFEYARRDWRWITTNPAKDVRKPPKPPGKKVVIRDRERERLLLALGYVEDEPPATLGAQVAYMLLLSLETGMRAGEMHALTWERVHLPARFLSLEESKNGDRRDVPLSTRAVQLLQRMRKIDRHRVFTVEPGTRDIYFRRAREACKLPAVTFHAARHTAATRIGKAGRLSLMEFCAMFGWRDPKMAMVYFNATAAELAAKLD